MTSESAADEVRFLRESVATAERALVIASTSKDPSEAKLLWNSARDTHMAVQVIAHDSSMTDAERFELNQRLQTLQQRIRETGAALSPQRR